MRRKSHPLWNFALRVYAAPGVETACLDLQERHGADINLLLYCCWAALAEPMPLGPERLRAAMEAVAAWQLEVVLPLRGVRRRLKAPPEGYAGEGAAALRRDVATAELDSEYLELTRLAGLVGQSSGAVSPDRSLEAGRENLIAYLRLRGAALSAGDQAGVETLLRAAVSIGH